MWAAATLISACVFSVFARAQGASAPQAAPALLNRQEGDFIIHDYRFRSGETLPGTAAALYDRGNTDPRPRWENSQWRAHHARINQRCESSSSAVIDRPAHGSRRAPSTPQNIFLIFPDILGAGKSSKPSDGLHAHFPKYGYQDLVDLEHRLVTEHFGIEHLHLVMGVSMGGMQSWMWAEPLSHDDGCRGPSLFVPYKSRWSQFAVAAHRYERHPHRSLLEGR